MSTTLKDKEVTIRKPHQCFSCLRKFPIGTKMRYWVGTVDGDFNSVYICTICEQIMSFDDENEYPEGYVTEMLEQGESPEELLKRLRNNS